jgi:hypothetical protein
VRKSQSLQGLLATAVLKTSLLLAVAALWLGSEQVGNGVRADAGAQVARPAASGSPRELIERYDCWTGQPPIDMVGKIPGHAVITIRGAGAAYVGTNGVGKALEHVFESQHPNIEVHAFCR